MDGVHNDTLFPDASPSAKVPTHVIAPVVTDSVAPKYGSAAASFTGGYLRYADSPDFDLAGGDFTIETWAKFSPDANASRVFIAGKSGPGGINNTIALAKYASNQLWVPWTTSTSSGNLSDPVPVAINTWIHIAVTRQGNTLSLWKNGALAASMPITGNFIPNPHHFGVGVLGEYTDYYGGGSGTKMMGWLDEFRITKGQSRYSAAFTPPSAVLGAATAQAARPSLLDTATPARTRQWSYTATGQVATETSPKNQTTTTTYYPDTVWVGTAPNQTGHQLGDLQTSTNRAGQTTTQTQYNKAGQLLQSTDPSGVITLNTFVARGRLLTTQVGAELTTYTYDAVGQLKKVLLPNAQWIGYDFDAAHRQTAIYDHQGNRIDYILDTSGNRVDTKTKDPAGQLRRQSQKVLDALSRVQQQSGQ
jgi:YD repeat-containing protein